MPTGVITIRPTRLQVGLLDFRANRMMFGISYVPRNAVPFHSPKHSSCKSFIDAFGPLPPFDNCEFSHLQLRDAGAYLKSVKMQRRRVALAACPTGHARSLGRLGHAILGTLGGGRAARIKDRPQIGLRFIWVEPRIDDRMDVRGDVEAEGNAGAPIARMEDDVIDDPSDDGDGGEAVRPAIVAHGLRSFGQL